MSTLSTVESRSSRNALDRIDADAKARAEAANCLREAFIDAASQCQDDKLVLFAPRVKSWTGGFSSNRLQTMAEVLMDSIDTRPLMARAMKVLMEAAAGKANQTDAQELIEELAAHWADMNAETVL